MQGSSLQSWTQRISNQLNDLLSPNPYNEIDPSEALQLSLHAHPSWTLLALAQQAKDAQFTAVSAVTVIHVATRPQSPSTPARSRWAGGRPVRPRVT